MFEGLRQGRPTMNALAKHIEQRVALRPGARGG
jgi:hypothetical protein